MRQQADAQAQARQQPDFFETPTVTPRNRRPDDDDDPDDDFFSPRAPPPRPQAPETALALREEGYMVPALPDQTDGGTTFIDVLQNIRSTSNTISGTINTMSQAAAIGGALTGMGIQVLGGAVGVVGSFASGVGSILAPGDYDGSDEVVQGQIVPSSQPVVGIPTGLVNLQIFEAQRKEFARYKSGKATPLQNAIENSIQGASGSSRAASSNENPFGTRRFEARQYGRGGRHDKSWIREQTPPPAPRRRVGGKQPDPSSA